MFDEIYENAYPELLASCLVKVDVPFFYDNDMFLVDLLQQGIMYLCYLKGRGICGIQRMMYTTAIVYGYDSTGYVGRYCYHTMAEAVEGLTHWDGKGDPDGNWIKHKGISEYSNANYEQEI